LSVVKERYKEKSMGFISYQNDSDSSYSLPLISEVIHTLEEGQTFCAVQILSASSGKGFFLLTTDFKAWIFRNDIAGKEIARGIEEKSLFCPAVKIYKKSKFGYLVGFLDDCPVQVQRGEKTGIYDLIELSPKSPTRKESMAGSSKKSKEGDA
jgi:hypothetical protein